MPITSSDNFRFRSVSEDAAPAAAPAVGVSFTSTDAIAKVPVPLGMLKRVKPKKKREESFDAPLDGQYLFEAVGANDAILMWPVKLLDQTKDSEGTRLHVTLNWGQWTGDEDALRVAAYQLLVGHDTTLPRITEWKLDTFKGQQGKTFHVLKIDALSGFVVKLRKAIRSVFPDNFGDAYTPHITVDESTWQQISDQKITPSEAALEVGPLELRRGNKVIEVFEGVVTESNFFDDLLLTEAKVIPNSQKMVLRDMLENERSWLRWPGGFYAPEDEVRQKGTERLFSVYVAFGPIRGLLNKGLIFQSKDNKGRTSFEPTPDGARALGYLP